MKYPVAIAVSLLLLLACGLSWGAQAAPAPSVAGFTEPSRMVLVLPFENHSQAPGLDWIAEAFPEVLGQRLASPSLYVIGRDDRLYAFDRLGLPANLRPSRATLYRIAEEMDADYVIFGNYSFDGRQFTGNAQLLDMRRLRLSPEFSEAGPLTELINIQRSLAWDLLRQLDANVTLTRQEFLAAVPAIRLDAFENYVRGVIAPTRQEKLRRLRETAKLDPDYPPALLQLGRTHYQGREYEAAAKWLAQVPPSDVHYAEASFYLGLSYLYLEKFERAEAAFSQVARQIPLTEVYNNLGVAQARQGKKSAIEHFLRAVQTDPRDADYRFNLALELYRAGDAEAAARHLKEAAALHPADGEIKALLETVNAGLAASGGTPASPRNLPVERIKRNYDETSFRQLALQIQNVKERRLASTDSRTHAAQHVENGQELLHQDLAGEAEKDFREAIRLDPTNGAAHAGLAQVLEERNQASEARAEAAAALGLQPSAEAYLVLARLDLRDNKAQAAGENVDRALALEPQNSAALALKQQIAARVAETSSSTPAREPKP